MFQNNELNRPTAAFPGGVDAASDVSPESLDGQYRREALTPVVDAGVPEGFSRSEKGVFYEDEKGVQTWICGPLEILAMTRNSVSEGWGRLLQWKDADGRVHSWAMPMAMLRRDGTDMCARLMDQGLDIAPGFKAHSKLVDFVTLSRPEARGRCATRIGWHGEKFLFPELTIGASSEQVIYQAESIPQHYSQSGTPEDWREGVARFCSGNRLLLFGVSVAFATMMLEVSGQDSCAFHIAGASSTGKTTVLRVACSVFGGERYMQTWNSTVNGLEGLAAQHNDTLLAMDEVSQMGENLYDAPYLVGNGIGKARAGQTGVIQQRQTWRLFVLSTGEVGLVEVAAAGKRVKAGQEVRMIEIPADAGAGFGVFENLHGTDGGAALSTLIKEAARQSFGTPSIDFLNYLTRERPAVREWLKDGTASFLADHLPSDANGQVHRVCQRFALIGLAGEYATGKNITGWRAGEALEAAAHCFEVWLQARGGVGDQETQHILAHVKEFFEQHEESRFSDMNKDSQSMSGRPTYNRAGYRRTRGDATEYFVFPKVFNKEICKGYNPRAVAKVLLEAGWIRPDNKGGTQRSERMPGKGTTRVYVFTPAMWQAE